MNTRKPLANNSYQAFVELSDFLKRDVVSSVLVDFTGDGLLILRPFLFSGSSDVCKESFKLVVFFRFVMYVHFSFSCVRAFLSFFTLFYSYFRPRGVCAANHVDNVVSLNPSEEEGARKW